MTAGAVTADTPEPKRRRFRLPDRVPPFNTRIYHLFSVVWFAALLLALGGTAGGLYQRYKAPEDNSQLVIGSRAGFAVSPKKDATHIRFLVGPFAREAGIRPGDDIIAIYGLPVPEKMPITDQAIEQDDDDPAYITMSNLLSGTEELEVPLTLRGKDGSVREVTITTGEQHIDAAGREIGFSPTLLSFIDLLHVLFYPFLIWAAWILHRRNARDAVSSILSLAILLLIGVSPPSEHFLQSVGAPFWLIAKIYDVQNILFIAGIVLFPHGKLSRRRVAVVSVSLLLLPLSGIPYNTLLIALLILGVLIQIRSLRAAESSDLRNQIRWALFGFTGYALFRVVSYASDQFKWYVGTFPFQLSLEVTAGLALGLSALFLQGGLLVALLRFRLYDAEAIISRTASIGIMAIGVTAIIAGVAEGIITAMQDIYPQAQTQAAMAGAIVATVFFHPLNERVQKWVEKRFHKGVIEIREQLPEMMRDTRDSASLDDFLCDVLTRIVDGFHATRAAVVLDGEVRQTVSVEPAEVLRWFGSFHPKETQEDLDCVPDDHLFPLRMRLETSGGAFGWLLIGPRPDGSIAGHDEQEALEKIAGTLGRSISIVVAREEEKQELLGLLDANSKRIDRIERILKLQS